jgi:CBS domain-containing protein
MTTARELMTPDAHCARTDETVATVAARMRDLGVGSLPICGEDQRLHGVVTDRDIVVGCVADGKDPSQVLVAEFCGEEPVIIGADDDASEALRTMMDHDVRRLPVIDGHELVGMLSQADVARAMPEDEVGRMLAAVSAPPSNA